VTTYAGAKGRIDLDTIARDRRLAVQPKIDGCYAELELDAAGRVAAVRSRTGRAIGADLHQLDGELLGAPHSVLVGELEAHTEAGIRAASALPRARPHVHLFDVLQVGRIPVGDLAYSHRRDALRRMRAELEAADLARPWTRDRTRRAHGDSGRFVVALEHGWRRAPIVEQWPAHRAGQAWREVVELGGGEGLVAVRLDAPIGRRGAKTKCKQSHDIDCVVAEVSHSTARMVWTAAGRSFLVARAARAARDVEVGQVWTVRSDGWYDDGAPKFPRLTSIRRDLA